MPTFRPKRQRAPKSPSFDPALFMKKANPVVEADDFKPAFEFKDLPLAASLRANILAKGYKTPTPIQNDSILPISEGRDVLGLANTGTGKTAAFLIPLLQKMIEIGAPHERILVLAPTREIAVQIHEECASLVQGTRIWATVCVGGLPIERQIRNLRAGPNVVIATPGRLRDLIERRALQMKTFNRLVLDEVDRMLDMGFMPDVRWILEHLPEEHQSLFFSATMPREVEDLVHSFLKNPVKVSVKRQDTSANVHQDVVWVGAGESRLERLIDVLSQPEMEKVLIFVRTKRGADRLEEALQKSKFGVACIHGDKSQPQRQRALEAFKKNKAPILVATDVAARGLDIPLVSHVINYELPQTYEDYVHRIGRTGRADNVGHALTFFDRDEAHTRPSRNAPSRGGHGGGRSGSFAPRRGGRGGFGGRRR